MEDAKEFEFAAKYDAWLEMENYNPYYWDCNITNIIANNLKSKDEEKPVWCIPPGFVRKNLLDYNYQCISVMQPFFVADFSLWPTTDVGIHEGNVFVYDEEHDVDMLFSTGSHLNAVVIVKEDAFEILKFVMELSQIRLQCVISDTDPFEKDKFEVWDYRLPNFNEK